jgi:hypothetical protein
MLGYVGSKSKPFVLKDEGINAFPDEVSYIGDDAQHALSFLFFVPIMRKHSRFESVFMCVLPIISELRAVSSISPIGISRFGFDETKF